ncbi:hypothetical protein [Kribbella sp. NBC_00662]|uniref:hypothetical protein n=1 Tax=Kribbella sp. NBC_00662 TaxID=2975969 RepID=UPI00352A9FC2
MHSELFRTTMRWLGLDDSYGRYVADVPAVTLAESNVMSPHECQGCECCLSSGSRTQPPRKGDVLTRHGASGWEPVQI